jgi:hypothetical protein
VDLINELNVAVVELDGRDVVRRVVVVCPDVDNCDVRCGMRGEVPVRDNGGIGTVDVESTTRGIGNLQPLQSLPVEVAYEQMVSC